MTNKFLLNLLGFNPDLTSRQPRVDTLSLVSRQSDLLTHLGRITAILVLVLSLGVGNAWGAGTTVTYTLTAKTTVSKSGTAPTGATATVTSTGSWYTTGSDGRKNTDQMTAGKNTVLTLSGFKGYKITGIVLNMCSNSSNGKGTFSAVAGSTTIASISSATNFNAWYDNTSYGTSRRDVNVSLTNSTYEIKQDEDVVITIACVTTNSLYISSWSITYEAVGGCSNSVAVTKGSESHGSVTTIATSPVATCSSTASDRRVTVTITPDECYDAPTNLTWTKSSGTVTASKQSGPTDNGDGTYSYVYQFAQNDNGAGTFGVTCTAKAAGKTVNFNAGPGSCGTSSLTETCDGSGVTLPAVTATGVCKGWTTFAGWATAAVSDSSTTSVTLYAAGAKFVPASNGQTLYAVYSKVKSGGGASWTLSTTAPSVGDSVMVAYYTGSVYKYMKNSGADNDDLTVSAGVATPVANGKFKLVSGNSYGVSLNSGSNYLHLNSSAINVTTGRTNGDINISSGSSANSFIIKRQTGASTYDRVLAWSGSNWTSSSSMGSGCEVYFFKRVTSTTYYCSDPNCCTELGTINGSVSLSQLATPNPTKLKATWSMNATTGIASYDLEVYNSSNVKVKTINNYTSGDEITGLDPCTTYYVKLYTVSSGGEYCDGGLIGTSSTCTTNGWGVSETLSHTTHATGASTACPATNYVATYTAETGYVLPASVSVSIGGVEKTQGTHYTWSVSDGTGTLTILAANITNSTGAIAITVTSAAAAYQFWYGGKGTAWSATSFTDVGNNEWQIANFVIPAYEYDGSLPGSDPDSKQMLWNVTGSGISATNREFYALTFAQTQHNGCGDYNYYNDGTNKDAWIRGAGPGAKGTLRIYDNKTDNGWCAFIPNEYVLQFGSSEVLFTETSTNVWETAITDLSTLNSGTWTGSTTYRVGVGDASHAFVAVSNKCAATAVSAMGYKTNAGDNWATGLNNISTARGKFRIWINNCTNGNWECHFVPYYRITYNGSGADGSTTASTDVSCEGNAAARTVQAAANGFTVPTGKSFGGWASSPENAAAGTVAYAAGADVVLTQSIVLYAIWTDIDYTVTVNQSPAAGATTTGQTTTAHYNGTINLTTTIPDGYRFVNWTTSDGFSITNSTSATTASFTMPNKSVTVTANFQQTHTVDWYVGGSAPANKIGDDGQTTVVDHGGKIEDFPATTPDGSACDKTFVGWTNTSSYVHGTSPLFNDVAGSPTINADASFYAVFATVTGGTDYEQVTSLDDIHDGPAYFAYYGSHSGSRWYGVNSVSTITAPVTVSEGVLTTSTGDYTLTEFTIVTVDAANHIYYIKIGDDYVIGSSSGSNTDLSLDDAPYAWTFESINSTTYNMQISHTYTTPSTTCYMKAGVGTATGGKFRSYPTTGQQISLFQTTGSVTGHTINCADCGTSVTPTFTAAPTGGTVSVTKSATPVTSGSTVKTCTSIDLSVTITPAAHYTLTGFTASGLTTGTATISPAVNTVVPTTSAQTFTVTVSASATGTLNLTPVLTEDAHIAINWNVNGVNQSIAATEGLTWVYSGEDLTAIPDDPSVPAGCTGTKVFAGWSEKHSDATEQDAAWYDDLFTNVAGAPTGIDEAKTFYAVFATSSSNPLAGETMWAEDFSGYSDTNVPSGSTSDSHTGTTVYNSGSVSYSCTDGGSATKVYGGSQTIYAGGTTPEILIGKSTGVFAVTGIPTANQTELTLSYKSNNSNISVSSGTSGVTIGDPSVSSGTYTYTITISQSPSTISSFDLSFSNTASGNSRLDDISLVVPGAASMTDYVTLCAPSYTITYNKNTEDAVTNLPSPTSVLQSTGSGTLSSTIPVRATYTFSGWAETTSGAVAYAAGGSITGVTGDKTLYAVWVKTPVEELTLNYSELNKYVGDPAVTLEVTGVTPEGADATVTWSSNNSTVASVVAATGVVTFGTVGTATITATSSVTGTTTAYCYVTVRNKPTASFTDLIHDGNGTDLSTYHMQNVAGTAIVFPTLDDYATPGDDCDSKHYIFVGWTTSDNNDDPEDHLVTSDELEDDQDKVFYAVWADGEEGVSYTQLTTSTFKTSPTKYVIGAIDGDDTFYFYSCAATDANNGNGGCTNAPGTNAPIQFTLSGTADALVATSTEATARYLTPLTAKNFQMSATSKTIQLNDDGTIANPSDDSWTLRFNTSEDYLRWYSSATGNAAYFYEVTAGAAVSYRTSCCTNNVPAPTVVATNTAYTVTLTWAAVDGATGYEVSWNGGAFEAATSPCVKSGLTASTDYIYKVRATYDPLVKCGALVASGSVTTDDVYSVTYSGGTGTGSCSPSGSVAPVSYEAGATVTLAPTNSFSLTSNTFAAWVVKDADDNDVPVSNNQFTMPAKNVTVTATWTAVQDKYYDRMHDGTDALHGGFADGEGKYYLVLEGCNYTVPTLTDDDDGDTDCHTTHFKLLGWIAQSHLKTDGSGEIKPGEESYIFQGGGTKSATGATYYAIWAIMTE